MKSAVEHSRLAFVAWTDGYRTYQDHRINFKCTKSFLHQRSLTLKNKVEINPWISDYEAVYIESSLKPMTVKVPPRKVYKYNKADDDGMKEELRSSQEEFWSKVDTEDVESLGMTFKSMIHYFPSKVLRCIKVQKPWFSREVKSLMLKWKKLFIRQRKTRNARDITFSRKSVNH